MSRLIVMSADALVSEDMALLETLPNYRRFLAGGSLIRRVRSVYPTITYPCHTTMISGVYPDRHGIIRNDILAPGMKTRPWLWFHDAVKPETPDLFKAAKAKGLTTAAVFWPVTGNHPHIDYLIDEYWTQSKEDTIPQAFARSGSKGAALEIVTKNAPLLHGQERKHPYADEFIIRCACDIITEYKPDLLMIHPANIDDYRHQYGVFHENIKQGILETDFYIGELCRAAMIAGVLDETNFALVSDHGQIDIKRVVHPNAMLARNGLIATDKDGNISGWDAVCVSGGTSACVYLKDPDNKVLYENVYRLLCELRDDGIYGIGKVFTAAEATVNEHLCEDFAFVLEGDGYTGFGENASGPVATPIDRSDYRTSAGSHGHLPTYGPQPVFAAKGPDFRDCVTMEEGRLIDEAPTFAAVLGLNLPGTDGRAVGEIIK